MSKALLSFDISAIKSYIFATDRLREIRGASALLDELNRVWIPEAIRKIAPEAQLIFAGGGSGLLVLDEAHLADAILLIKRTCRERTEAVQIHLAAISIPQEVENAIDTKQKNRLGLQLRLAKGETPALVTTPTHSFLLPCESCGDLYATAARVDPDGGERAVCRACDLKIERDRQIKSNIDNDSWPGFWERLRQNQRVRQALTGKRRADNFDELTSQGSPEGILALLYADGDGLGKLFSRIGTLEEMTSTSQAVEESLIEAVAESIVGPLRLGDTAKILPFDILLLGGDDLVIATTADRAFGVAKMLVNSFHLSATRRLGQNTSVSIGISIANSHYPLHTLLELAEGALRHAKRERFYRLRKNPESELPGLISYILVGNASHSDFESYEREELYQQAANGQAAVRRTSRPFTPDELDQMLEITAEASKLPQNKLETLRSTAYMNYRQAILEGRFVLSRLREKQRPIVSSVMDQLAAGREVEFPWIMNSDELINPWADIVELLDFVKTTEEQEADYAPKI
jgi:hypothetical protein